MYILTSLYRYQAQHQAFVSHAMQQILALQQQKQNLESQTGTTAAIVLPNMTQNIPQPNIIQPPNSLNQTSIPHEPLNATSLNQSTNPPAPSLTLAVPPQALNPPPSLMQTAPLSTSLSQNNVQHLSISPANIPPPSVQSENYLPPINPNVPPPIIGQPNMALSPSISQAQNLGQPPLNISQPPNGLEHPIPFNQPPPPVFLPGVFPDFSKPPPGFPVPPKPEVVEDLMPSVPYYDLPAGLMIPLIQVIVKLTSISFP